MNRFKFIVKDDGYYGGLGSSGTVSMSLEFNTQNEPTKYHKWNGVTWVLQEAEMLADYKVRDVSVIESLHKEEIEKRFTYNYKSEDHTFWCSDSTVNKIINSSTRVINAVAKGATPTVDQLSFYCCGKHKVTFDNADEFIDFAMAIQDHVDAIDKRRIELTAAVESCETLEELESLSIVF